MAVIEMDETALNEKRIKMTAHVGSVMWHVILSPPPHPTHTLYVNVNKTSAHWSRYWTGNKHRGRKQTVWLGHVCSCDAELLSSSTSFLSPQKAVKASSGCDVL